MTRGPVRFCPSGIWSGICGGRSIPPKGPQRRGALAQQVLGVSGSHAGAGAIGRRQLLGSAVGRACSGTKEEGYPSEQDCCGNT